MGGEVLIYGYGLICLSMLIFNLIYAAHLRSDAKRTVKRTGRIAALAAPLLEGGGPAPACLERLSRRLERAGNLLALDEWLRTLEPERAELFFSRAAPLFGRLADAYAKRGEIDGAYFCHFIAGWGEHLGPVRDGLVPKLAAFARRKSLYSRVNALKALCALGDGQAVLDTLAFLCDDASGAYIHQKIVVETLMGFSGDYHGLIALIWERFGRFPAAAQRTLLDYIRFRSGEYSDKMLKILLDGGLDKELRFAAVRYFGRYPDERARETLLRFASDTDTARWEYAAISASSLASYPGEDTFQALSSAMHSPNWYVRYNSATSLEKLGFDYEDLLGGAAGSDRYAREMLTYWLETRRLTAEEGKKEAVRA